MLSPDECAEFIEVLYRSYSVRVHKHTDTSKLWFCLSDVCKVLNVTNPSYLSKRINSDNKHKHKLQSYNGKIPVVWVDYDGLIQLLESLPESKELNHFWRWCRRLYLSKKL